MLKREQLINTFVLVDSRIPPQAIDLEFIQFLGEHQVPLSIVFTKIDKQKQRELAQNLNTYKQTLSEQWDPLPEIFLTSSVNKYGKEALLDRIDEINHSL